MNNTLFNDLSAVFGKQQLLTSDLYREIYARDASYFNIKPETIVRPVNPAEVQELLRIATRHRINVTFRSGGTSLSGQSINEGIICELRTDWKKWDVRDKGKKIWFEPGLTAHQVNTILQKYHTKIGPDPASAIAAMMGGILSNNSSGMQTGVQYNAYHTLSSVQFILANSHFYDSASLADHRKFEDTETELARGLLEIRTAIMNDDSTRNRIIEKYKIKNVTGYSMNAFVDFETPMDIFSHLLIGAEGTLAFIVSAELNTLPVWPVYSSAMLYFTDVTQAAAAAPVLAESGALSVEMMDYAALMSYMGHSDLQRGNTALLVDYGAASPEEMQEKVQQLLPRIRQLKGILKTENFTHTVEERGKLWKIRDGIFPCVAGARIPGQTIILEDVAAPVEKLDHLVGELQQLFHKHHYEGSIFGHARDGNIHPLITSDMKTQTERDHFARFIEDMVNLVLSLDGSLKGEHGTGRAIAPFVEKEWGSPVYSLMKRLKKLADPEGILNRGVILNDDPEAHLSPIKEMTLFGEALHYKLADTCIECGFCEHVCPSRYITLTPRQRLQGRRIISRTGDPELEKQYDYDGDKTCAADGSCQLPCPMGINTGIITDALRYQKATPAEKKLLLTAARHFGGVEKDIRSLLQIAVSSEKVISPHPLLWATNFLHKVSRQFPHWSSHFPLPSQLHYREQEDPQFIYFPSCVTRIFGASSLGKDDLMTVVLRIADKTGIRIRLPREAHGLCCSQIWEHKGNPEGEQLTANRTIERLYQWTDKGRIPVFCDTTSCTHTLIYETEGDILTPENREKFKQLHILDITQWIEQYVLPRAQHISPKKRILLHPTCSCEIMNLTPVMLHIARKCAQEVILPDNWGCCGASGDRGFIYPELSESATRDEKKEINGNRFDGCYSLARTCEIAMQDHIGQSYESIVYLVDETIQ